MNRKSIIRLPRQPAESPVVLNCVFIGSFAHVVDPRVSDGEALLCYILHQVDSKRDFLVVVTGPKCERNLAVPGVHHMLIPLSEIVGNAFQQ